MKLATAGKAVVLDGRSWVVDEAYTKVTKSKDEIFTLGDSHRRQRQVSDI